MTICHWINYLRFQNRHIYLAQIFFSPEKQHPLDSSLILEVVFRKIVPHSREVRNCVSKQIERKLRTRSRKSQVPFQKSHDLLSRTPARPSRLHLQNPHLALHRAGFDRTDTGTGTNWVSPFLSPPSNIQRSKLRNIESSSRLVVASWPNFVSNWHRKIIRQMFVRPINFTIYKKEEEK